MKQYLFMLLFFTGVLPVIQVFFRKYYLIPNLVTRSDALAYCRAKYTDLASFENLDEIARAKAILQSNNYAASVWIGLYNDVNSWRWSMGNVSLGSLTDWFPPNPDDNMAREFCGSIDPSGWFDTDCTTLLPCICFDDMYTGNSSYIYVPINMTWAQAQSYCRQYHTDLASAGNQAENLLIKAMIPGQVWFGLFRDSWKWSDGTKFTSIPWYPGEPSNLLLYEQCVFFVNGLAGDVICSRLKAFLCYAGVTGQKQIVKVTVKATEDANDLAVKTSILDKIQQKLSDHGNITAKWRERPDGLVFNKIKESSTLATDSC